MSECDEAMLYAYNKGYRVTEDGRLINPRNKEISGTKNKLGYVFFNIRMSGKYGKVKVHRLAAYQKFGKYLFDAECVRHLNGNPSDFSLNNIEIGSFSQNMMDIPRKKRIRKSITAASYVRKYNNNFINEVKNFYRMCTSYKETMRHFGITSKGTLHYLINK